MPDDILELGFWSYYHRRDVEWIKLMKVPFRSLPKNVTRQLGRPPTIVKLSLNAWVNLTSALLRLTI